MSITPRQRLSDISHYYLSNEIVCLTPEGVPQLLPVILEQEQSNPLVYALARELHRHNINAQILHIDAGLRHADPRSSRCHNQLSDSAAINYFSDDIPYMPNPPPQLCLVPDLTLNKSYLDHCKHIVILLSTSDTGLLQSYQKLKQLATYNEKIVTGIIVVGAPNRSMAYAQFDKLAAGVLRFLGWQLGFIGSLPAISEVDSDIDSWTTIVTALLRNGFVSPAQSSAQGEPK